MQFRFRIYSLLAILGICIGFIGTSFSVLVYMAKDYNSYNLVLSFFNVDTSMRLQLEQLPISKALVLRILNLSATLFPWAAMMYALHLGNLFFRKQRRLIAFILCAVFSLQVLLFDYRIVYWIYMNGIGPFENIFLFNSFYRVAALVLRWVDRLTIVSACLIMLISCFLAPRSLRIRYVLLMFLLSGVSAVYLYLYDWLPNMPIWMSRIAHYVRFDSLPVDKPTALNAIMPPLSCLMILAFCAASFFHLWQTSHQLFDKVQFRNKVNASEMVSRTFCHYLKNEILSQQAELRLLQRQLPPDLEPVVEHLITHNEEIYERLTSVYNSIRERKITSHPLDLSDLLNQTAHAFSERERVQISLHIPQQPILIQGNSYQLQEVIQCILRNSLEAERSLNAPLHLRVTLTSSRQYAQIKMSNNSVRIPWNIRNRIFDPFFTTKNTQQNWGLGLSLCRNIIILHHGQIWVDEHTENGITWTDFYILLRTIDA